MIICLNGIKPYESLKSNFIAHVQVYNLPEVRQACPVCVSVIADTQLFSNLISQRNLIMADFCFSGQEHNLTLVCTYKRILQTILPTSCKLSTRKDDAL